MCLRSGACHFLLFDQVRGSCPPFIAAREIAEYGSSNLNRSFPAPSPPSWRFATFTRIPSMKALKKRQNPRKRWQISLHETVTAAPDRLFHYGVALQCECEV